MGFVKMIGRIFIFCLWIITADGATNLLDNADMESTNYNGNWYCIGCHMEPSNDAHRGQHSIKVTGRTQNWASLAQNLYLQGGSRYKATAYVKLLNTAGSKTYQDVEMMLTCKDSNGKAYYTKMGQTPHMMPGSWYQIGGVVQIQSDSHSCHIYIQTDANTDYLVDSGQVELVPYDNDWRSKANQRIDHLRKADVTVSLTGSDVDSSSVEIELQQNKMEFAFGSAVSATKIVDPGFHAYQQAFYENFEWGVLENALKWQSMEHNRGHINYDRPLNAIKAMRNHGIKMRCHCAFWDKDEYVQDWVKGLHGDALKSAIHERITGVVGHTKGMCEQWDVNNEMLHADFYERQTGDPAITQAMFRQIHAVDSHPLLFLNDYSVISYHDAAVALKDLALKYKAAGVPIGGLGVQGHMTHFDVHTIKAHLDILEEAGLPVMITEFAVNDKDEHSKANNLRDLLTLFFSHPAVKGVLFWGFWDGQIWEHDAALFTGNSVAPNEAGRVYQDLFQNTWRTHVTHTIHGREHYHVRGFKGEYTLTVKHNGHVLKTQSFTLDDGGKTLQVLLNGNTGGSPSVSHVIVG